jgi:predicted lactoylglutathione lyase
MIRIKEARSGRQWRASVQFYPGITLVTLGVANVEEATRFYESLGWKRSRGASQVAISFFQLNTLALALFERHDLAADAGLRRADGDASGAFNGVTLAQNHGSKAAVDAVVAKAEAAGARVLKSPGDTDWGGYHGVFADPDGHVWEVCWNPFFPLAADGTIALPP